MKKLIFVIPIIFIMGCATLNQWAGLPPPFKNRQNYIKENPSLPENFKDAILNARVTIGMTENQVRASLGYPKYVSTTTTSYGEIEQWVYGDDVRSNKYLYFKNGVLTTIQD